MLIFFDESDIVASSAVPAVAALPDVSWLPDIFTPGKSILVVPLNDTFPIFRGLVKLIDLASVAVPDSFA